MSLANVKPGDTVVLSGLNSTRQIVKTVGRTWITVQHRRARFSRETGAMENYNQYRIMTEADWDEHQRVAAAAAELRSLGIDPRSVPDAKILAVLEAVRPILEGQS